LHAEDLGKEKVMIYEVRLTNPYSLVCCIGIGREGKFNGNLLSLDP
jgi:hypothetical protein